MARQRQANRPELVEVNLIRDRVDSIRRRHTLGKAVDIGSILMLGTALLFCLIAACHLFNCIRHSRTVARLNAELSQERERADSLEVMKRKASRSVSTYQNLLPLYERRIPWAPKLTVLGQSITKGMSVTEVNIWAGEIFSDESAQGEDQTDRPIRRRRGGDNPDPKLEFKLAYYPVLTDTDDPLADVRTALEDSEVFMSQLRTAELWATDEHIVSYSLPEDGRSRSQPVQVIGQNFSGVLR
jgi:hypothetical protein